MKRGKEKTKATQCNLHLTLLARSFDSYRPYIIDVLKRNISMFIYIAPLSET